LVFLSAWAAQRSDKKCADHGKCGAHRSRQQQPDHFISSLPELDGPALGALGHDFLEAIGTDLSHFIDLDFISLGAADQRWVPSVKGPPHGGVVCEPGPGLGSG